MAKWKVAKGKKKSAIAPGGISCVVLLVAGTILFLLFLYYIGKNS